MHLLAYPRHAAGVQVGGRASHMASRRTGGQIERPVKCFGAPVAAASDEGASAGSVDSCGEPRRASRHKSAAPAILSSAISPYKRFRLEEGVDYWRVDDIDEGESSSRSTS